MKIDPRDLDAANRASPLPMRQGGLTPAPGSLCVSARRRLPDAATARGIQIGYLENPGHYNTAAKALPVLRAYQSLNKEAPPKAILDLVPAASRTPPQDLFVSATEIYRSVDEGNRAVAQVEVAAGVPVEYLLEAFYTAPLVSDPQAHADMQRDVKAAVFKTEDGVKAGVLKYAADFSALVVPTPGVPTAAALPAPVAAPVAAPVSTTGGKRKRGPGAVAAARERARVVEELRQRHPGTSLLTEEEMLKHFGNGKKVNGKKG